MLLNLQGYIQEHVRQLLLLLLLFFAVSGYTQQIHIKRATGTIVIDGKLDEEDWTLADSTGPFRQFFPMDTSYANAQSVVRMTYDDKFVYIGAKMYNLGPRRYVTPSLRRDFRGEGNDGITVVFDPFLDRTNGFMFGVNPFGVQREGLIANGGTTGQDLSLVWDNKWYSAAEIYDDYWIAEMAIPFKTLRFKDETDTWYVNFYRIDSQYAERSTWSPIPRNFDIVTLAFNRELIWDEPLKKTGSNISLIPYVAANGNRNFIENTPTEKSLEGGFDAKIAVSSALNLDVTVNPDFSQVEVDAQVTNLDRFEIFFPEQRQFFLENADLFADFGVEGTRPFFSRRIGIAVDTATGQNIQNQIYGGVRLSGKIDNNWRVGFLNIQGAEDPSIGLPSTNYMVATVQRKVFARSNIAMMMVNREQLGFIPEEKGGEIAGKLIVIDVDSETGKELRIDCTKFGSGAYSIPISVEHLKFETEAKFILAIETAGMFQRLVKHKYWQKANCILASMGGVPTRACRRFIRRLSDAKKLPVYVFTDGDCYGYLNIYRTLKVGSGNAAHINEYFCVPNAQFLGVTPQDIIDYKLPTHPLKEVDIKRAKDGIKNDPFVKHYKQWEKALKQMIDMKVRAEQQALAKWGLNYVMDKYLPDKIKNTTKFLP